MNIFEKIKEMQILSPKPGDILIVKVSSEMTNMDKKNIGEHISIILNKNELHNDIVIIDDSIEISILRKEDKNE